MIKDGDTFLFVMMMLPIKCTLFGTIGKFPTRKSFPLWCKCKLVYDWNHKFSFPSIFIYFQFSGIFHETINAFYMLLEATFNSYTLYVTYWKRYFVSQYGFENFCSNQPQPGSLFWLLFCTRNTFALTNQNNFILSPLNVSKLFICLYC